MTIPKDARRNLLVDVLIVLFGVSSWIAVNGLWMELPLLVQTLPESWKLPAYIIITTQVANLGPIAFSAARKLFLQKVFEVALIHACLAAVVVSCGLLCFFWDTTVYISGEFHSLALYVLTFLVSCVDCTSSLLYLPYIANFKEQYVISYMIGSGLSGPIPGVLALAQGVGGYAQCVNTTVANAGKYGNETQQKLEPYYPPPRFSVNVFFAVVCAQMVISWIAFVLLDNLPQTRKERAPEMPVTWPKTPALEENFQSSVDKSLSMSLEKTLSSEDNLLGKPALTPQQFYSLLSMQGFVCALNTGLLSVQSFSCLPYGSLAFHLTVILSNTANPLCCFAAMFWPVTSVGGVLGATAFTCVWAVYALVMALLSPHPLLVGTAGGSFLVVFAWVLLSGAIAYIKSCNVSILRKGGQTALYHCGVVTQIGSALGAIVSFLLIQYTTLFHSFSPCS